MTDRQTGRLPKGLRMLSYPASIPLSTRSLVWLAEQIRAPPGGDPVALAAAGPGPPSAAGAGPSALRGHLRPVGRRVRHRYLDGVPLLRESIDLIATMAPTLEQVVRRTAALVWVILDGTQIPIDRVADQKPYDNGHKRRHTVNTQFLTDTRGRLLWTSPALPGSAPLSKDRWLPRIAVTSRSRR